MLEIRNLSAGYGRINILWDVSLQVREGELTTILGPNGAGKTTLLRALTGLVPHADEIRLGGDLKGRTWGHAVLGLVMVPEGRIVSRDMSVDANLCLGAYSKCCRNDVAPSLERVYDPFPRLEERRGQMAGSLSGG